MESVILARHGESVFSARQLVNGDVVVPGPLTERGVEEARELGRAIAADPVDLCITSEFERTRQTADVALEGRVVPRARRSGAQRPALRTLRRRWARGVPVVGVVGDVA